MPPKGGKQIGGVSYEARYGGVLDDTGTEINEANFIRGAFRAMAWLPTLKSDTGPNDSDKNFPVPVGKEWRVRSIHVDFTSTSSTGVAGSTGDRQIEVQFQATSTGVLVASVRAGVVHATDTVRKYLFAPHVADLTAFRDTDSLSNSIPDLILKPNFKVRVFDNNNIRSTADDLVLRVMVDERDVPST